jgi:hypothetical protein
VSGARRRLEADFPEIALAPCPELERFLLELALYLRGVVPDADVRRFLEETSDHLEAMLEERGPAESRTESTILEVVGEFGEPRRLADNFIEAWYNRRPGRRIIERMLGPGNMLVLSLFGSASLAYWVLLQFRVFLPSDSAFHLPWSPGQIRRFFPEPLPFPDFSWQFLLLTGIPVLAPPILGWLVGRLVPVRPHVTVYGVLMLLIVASYAIGVSLLPVTDGLVFAGFQTVYWLPVGCGCAYLSSKAARRRQTRLAARLAGEPCG